VVSEEARLKESDLVLGSIIDFKPKSSVSSLKPLQSSEGREITPIKSENRFRKNSEQRM
jgi:hypothetical protein